MRLLDSHSLKLRASLKIALEKNHFPVPSIFQVQNWLLVSGRISFHNSFAVKKAKCKAVFFVADFFWLKLKMAKVVESNKIYILILSLKVT